MAVDGINGHSREANAASRPTASDRVRLASACDWCAAELRNPGSRLSNRAIRDRLDDMFYPAEESPLNYSMMAPQYTSLREIIVGGFLRRGEIANLISAAKVGKTWLLLSLLLCAASGRDWLGHRIYRRCNVLAIDNELHQETFVYRVRVVAEALGIHEDEFGSRLYIECIRGKSMDARAVREKFTRKYRSHALDIFSGDSLYKMIASGGDENSNTGMKVVFETFGGMADDLNAAMVAVHHSSKGSQADKDVTDVGSGAGAISRAADSHLILRQHAEDDCAVMEARVRSFEPLPPKVLRWEFPLWTIAEGLDPNLLRNSSKGRQQEKDAEARMELLEIVRRVIAKGGKATVTAIRKGSKLDADAPEWRREKVQRIVKGAVNAGQLTTNEDSDGTHYTPSIIDPQDF